MQTQLLHTGTQSLFATKPRCKKARTSKLYCRAEKAQNESKPGFGLKATWTAAERFGDFLGRQKGKSESSSTTSAPSEMRKMSRSEIIASLREDYDNNYFVSGSGSMEAYEPDCEFADPFASFRGTKRFKKNVSNLGGLAQDVKCDILDWREEENSISTEWRFSAVLDLPWRPLLAAKGGTTHFLNKDTGRVEKHLEMWDTEPQRVLKTLLKPTAKFPTNQWEAFFMALSAGDVAGIWFASTQVVLKGASTLLAGLLAVDLLNGRGLQSAVTIASSAAWPGVASVFGLGEELCYLLVASCLITEAVKFAQGMQGGETGTGGRF